jgi:hypothetical protein
MPFARIVSSSAGIRATGIGVVRSAPVARASGTADR